VQTTLLGLAIAFIIALVAALIGPYSSTGISSGRIRGRGHAGHGARRSAGSTCGSAGRLDARLVADAHAAAALVVVGGPNDLGKVRADKLDVEFSLGSLMRGEWRADQLTIKRPCRSISASMRKGASTAGVDRQVQSGIAGHRTGLNLTAALRCMTPRAAPRSN